MSDQIAKIKPLEKTPTMARRLAQYLARLIADGTLKPGEKLPGETALADKLGVSRPTLREALGVLQAKNLVEVRPRSGTYVTNSLPQSGGRGVGELVAVDPEKIWELLEIRKVVETAAASLAAQRRNTADLARLDELRLWATNLGEQAMVMGREGGKAYGQTFSFIAHAAHNILFAHVVEWVTKSLRDLLPYSRARMSALPGAGHQILSDLVSILDAIEKQNPQDAYQRTLDHLEFIERSLRRLHGQDPDRFMNPQPAAPPPPFSRHS